MHGESYRVGREKRVAELGLADNIHVHDRFVSLEEFCKYLRAADVYVTPYLNPDQITSATASFLLVFPAVAMPARSGPSRRGRKRKGASSWNVCEQANCTFEVSWAPP